MKLYLKISILLLLFLCNKSISQGIKFINASSWNSVLIQAKNTRKPIFVDVSTSWCGPCKQMEKSVFTQSEVGSYYNEHFISVKLDAEVGWGITFSANNKVSSYPSFIYFSPDGDILLASSGSQLPNSFIGTGKQAINNYKSGVSLSQMREIIKSGKYSSIFLENYIKRLGSNGIPNFMIIEDYLSLIPIDSLYTEHTLSLLKSAYLGRINVNSLAFKVLLHSYEKYPVKSGELMSPWNTIRNKLLDEVDSAGIQSDSVWLINLKKVNELLDTIQEIKVRERLYLDLRYYAAARDSVNFRDLAEIFIQKYLNLINRDSLYQLDTNLFHHSLLIKYPNTDYSLNKNSKEYVSFQKSFNSEVRRTISEIMSILFYNKFYFHSTKTIGSLSIVEVMKDLISLYANNSIYVSDLLISNWQKDMTKY